MLNTTSPNLNKFKSQNKIAFSGLAQKAPSQFHKIDDQLFAGAKPFEEREMKYIRSHAKTIVSLLSPKANTEEKQMAKKLGIDFIDLPIYGIEQKEKYPVMRKFCALFSDKTVKKPIYLHCRCGIHATPSVANFYSRFKECCNSNLEKLDEKLKLLMQR